MKNTTLILLIFLGSFILACNKDFINDVPVLGKLTKSCGKTCLRKIIDGTDTTIYTDLEKIAYHAEYQTHFNTKYDGSYVSLSYPGGDPGYQQGVCTDVIIRALRLIDIDLQELIHNDMKANHSLYNLRYKTKTIDRNIDHRRTQNMQTYLTKLGAKIEIPTSPDEYKPGDILFWDISAGHTGIVSNTKSGITGNYYVVHNIGRGAQYEDLLQSWQPIEVYRLNDSSLQVMKEESSFKYDLTKDFKIKE